VTASFLFAEVTRLVTLHNQTEGVTYRVQEHSEGLPGLVIGFSSTDAKDVTFSLVKIINFKVKMHLFRVLPSGQVAPHNSRLSENSKPEGNHAPSRCLTYLPGRNPATSLPQCQLRPSKIWRAQRVGTVKQDKVQSWKFHTARYMALRLAYQPRVSTRRMCRPSSET